MAKPDYILKALDKVTDEKAKIGAAWKGPKGSISIRLDLCTVIKHDKNMLYTLFPAPKDGIGSEEEPF